MASGKRKVIVTDHQLILGEFEHSGILRMLNDYKELIEKLPFKTEEKYWADLSNYIMVVEDAVKFSREVEEYFDDDIPF